MPDGSNRNGTVRCDGRGGEIRTPDPLLPKQMRYQAALRPDCVYSTTPGGVWARARCFVFQRVGSRWREASDWARYEVTLHIPKIRLPRNRETMNG
jgi:hypothetical protein